MASERHTCRFPGESAEYRTARNALLEAEIEFRRRIEEIAALRRNLPLGGPVADYVFEEGAADLSDKNTVKPVHLAELFRDGTSSLLLYSFMFGPDMPEACSSCTSILDGLNGQAAHVEQRVSFAVVAKSPLARIRQFARGRGWANLRLLSSAGNTYNVDYHGENTKGSQLPALNVFVRRSGIVHHFYCTELLFARSEPGQDGRHVDQIWPLWNLFDLTPEGRGVDWNPRLSYEPAVTPMGKRSA